MKLWLFVLIIILYLNTVIDSFDLEISARVITSVKVVSKSECVFLLYSPGFKNMHILGELRRLLATFNIETSVMTFQMLDSILRENNCQYIHPLSIIVFNDNITMESLKLSSTSYLTRTRWLLFLENGYHTEQLLTDVYIPFNCEFLVVQQEDHYVTLSEVYRINKTLPLQINHFGNWTPHAGLSWSRAGFYRRRNDLLGLTIRGGYIDPGSIILQEGNASSPPKAGGFFSEVWLTLQEQTHFKTEYQQTEDRSSGSVQKNGKWNGLVGMLIRNQIDIGVHYLTVTKERNEKIDFTMPILRARLSMFIRKPGRNIFMWNNFLAPFSTEIWVCVICTMLVLALFLSILSHISQRYTQDNIIKFNLFEAFYYVYTSFCQQGCSVTPISTSCRIVCLVTKFTATVILAGYSAYLIAHLAVHRPHLPFRNFESLLEDGTYKLGVLPNTSNFMFFSATNDTVLKKVYDKLITPDELPSSDREGLQRVCRDKKYTYTMRYKAALSIMKTVSCQVTTAWKSQTRSEMAFPIAKGSPYRGIINHYLILMRRAGILHRLHSKWYPPRAEEMKKRWDSVPIDAVAAIILIPVLGIVVAMLVLAGECLIHRHSLCVYEQSINEAKYNYYKTNNKNAYVEAGNNQLLH